MYLWCFDEHALLRAFQVGLQGRQLNKLDDKLEKERNVRDWKTF